MPRTVEHIVACHQDAARLQKAGKPIWSKTIDVKRIIARDHRNESPAHIMEISHEIAKLLRWKAAEFLNYDSDNWYPDLVDVVEEMEAVTLESLERDRNDGIESVDQFNGWLEAIFDWADRERIWMGS